MGVGTLRRHLQAYKQVQPEPESVIDIKVPPVDIQIPEPVAEQVTEVAKEVVKEVVKAKAKKAVDKVEQAVAETAAVALDAVKQD